MHVLRSPPSLRRPRWPTRRTCMESPFTSLCYPFRSPVTPRWSFDTSPLNHHRILRKPYSPSIQLSSPFHLFFPRTFGSFDVFTSSDFVFLISFLVANGHHKLDFPYPFSAFLYTYDYSGLIPLGPKNSSRTTFFCPWTSLPFSSLVQTVTTSLPS